MTETTKRVPVSEYPGADEAVWVPNYSERVGALWGLGLDAQYLQPHA